MISITLLASFPFIQSVNDTPEPNFQYAPPPIEVEGLIGLPIDIVQQKAKLKIDASQESAVVEASFTFWVSPGDGFPVFDLRQEILSASLDGTEINPSLLSGIECGKEVGSLRFIQERLDPDVLHSLQLNYTLEKPQAPQSKDLVWSDNNVVFQSNFTDLKPGRYLEQWFPSNLIYDTFGFNLEIQLQNANEKHVFLCNGAAQEKDAHHWVVQYPDHFTSFSPLFIVAPNTVLEQKTATVGLDENTSIQLHLSRRTNVGTSMDDIQKRAEKTLREFHQNVGDWPHGSSCTLLVWKLSGSMEYDGATTSRYSAIRHELFHSWFGRGVKPASQNDAWWDEGWDVYYAGNVKPYSSKPKKGRPQLLYSKHPWNRITSAMSYSGGSNVFKRIAFYAGDKALKEAMSDFFKQHALKIASTQDLQIHLEQALRSEEVRSVFKRYVYGIDD